MVSAVTISATERDDTIVRLHFCSEGPRVVVEALAESTGRLVCALSVPMMAAWLKRHGYQCEVGSQARWMKTA